MISHADRARQEELVALVRGGGVLAGQMVALSLGADPQRVEALGRVLMGGEPDDQR